MNNFLNKRKLEIEEKPSILLAIILPFMGYPFMTMVSILLIPFTFFMSVGLIVYVSFWKATLLGGFIGIMTYTIPTIIYFKTKDYDKFRIYKSILGVFSITIVFLFLLNGGFKFITPKLCNEVMQSNVTIYGGGFCK